MSEKSDWEQGYDQAQRRFYEERKILTARIAELEGEVTRLLTERDDAIMAEARYIAEVELAKKDTRIAELEEERRWIPVSERLPEKGNLVIGITDYCGYVFFEIVDDDGQGIVLHPYRRCQGKVTHWMPLPQPPEVQE